MSAPREEFLKVITWPAALLALAAALYVAAWSVPMYYALMPARFAFELRAGAEHAAEFRARLDTTYIVVFELERDLYMSRCLLGDPDIAPALCSGVPAVLDLAWSVTSGGKVVASGDSGVRVRGFGWDFSAATVIGRFDAVKGGRYRVRVESRKDGKMLNAAGPNVAVQADSLSVQRRYPGVFKAQVMAVPWLKLAAGAVAAIGVFWSLVAAAYWYVHAPGAERDPPSGDAVAARKPLSGTETYRIEESFRRGMTVSAWIGATLTVVLAYFALFRPPADPDNRPVLLAALAFLAAGTLLALRARRQSGKRIEVSASGIAEIRPDGARVSLEWHEIGEIRHRAYHRCLELRSSGPSVQVIRIEEQSERFAALRDLVIGNAPQAAIKGTGAAARRDRIGRRTSYAFWIVAVLAAAGPSLWEYAFFNALAANVSADRATLEKSSRTLSLYRRDALLKRYRVALGRDAVDRDRPAGAGIEEGAYQVLRGRHKRFGDTLWLHPSAGDGAARNGTQRRETSIHGPVPGGGFLARLHRLRDWTDGGVGLTHREIEELMRVVPEGTPIEVRP